MGSSIDFMVNFIHAYLNGETDQWEFDLDYDGYLVEHFPAMELENPALAQKFAAEIDGAVEYARRQNLGEDAYKRQIVQAYNNLLGSTGRQAKRAPFYVTLGFTLTKNPPSPSAAKAKEVVNTQTIKKLKKKDFTNFIVFTLFQFIL